MGDSEETGEDSGELLAVASFLKSQKSKSQRASKKVDEESRARVLHLLSLQRGGCKCCQTGYFKIRYSVGCLDGAYAGPC